MTTDLPPSSTDPDITITPSDEVLGLSLDCTHEVDAVYLSLRLRIPRKGALKRLVDALTAKDSGYHRFGGPNG